MNQIDIHTAAAAIRKRLFNLLFQSFSAVIIVILILVLGVIFFIFYQVSNYYPPFRPMLSNALEAYYLGKSSWDGVDNLVPKTSPVPMSMEQDEWWDSILLDRDYRVLLDHGKVDTPLIGKKYRLFPGDSPIPLHLGNQQIGTLIVTRQPSGFDVLNSVFLPLGTIIFFLGILTLLIGSLLSQRLINPLAEVIAASRAVTTGDLKARVKVQGPDDLRVLSDSFNQMASSLEKNDNQQRNLIADIAHELRTPLTIVQGKLEGIIDGLYPPDKAHLQPILQETSQLEGLISDLDMLSQADLNQLDFSYSVVNLDDLAGQAVVNFEVEAGEKKINISRETAGFLPEVIGDALRINQVITNLLSNAVRYIPESGEVIILTTQVDDGVQLTVSDNGPGIPEEDLPHIFDRFWRAEKSRSRKGGGVGLGLAIARQFIEIQGGRIWAANRPQGGLVVGFIMPAAKYDAANKKGRAHK